MTDEFVKLLDQGCADLGIELSDQQRIERKQVKNGGYKDFDRRL